MGDARRAVDALRRVLDPGEVLLFGSVARGEQVAGSDLDLVLVFDDLGDYTDRHRIAGEAREAVRDAVGLGCDVRVTDRPEWEVRTKRCRSTFEAHIASHAVTLLSRPPAPAIDWDKEIGMAPTDEGQAADSLANAEHALTSLQGQLSPWPAETKALSAGDINDADRIKHSRILNVCAFSQTVMENSLKALIHALEGPHPEKIHKIGDLLDAARPNLSQPAAEVLAECLGPIAPEEASVWRQTSACSAEVGIDGDPGTATELFAAQMAEAAAQMAMVSIAVIEQKLGYRPPQADLCLARCARIARIQQHPAPDIGREPPARNPTSALEPASAECAVLLLGGGLECFGGSIGDASADRRGRPGVTREVQGARASSMGYMGARRDAVLGKHREAIRAAAARNKADSIALVGSVARGDDSDDSDCDFLARFKQGASLFDQAGLKLELEELLGCDVDVISVGGLKDKHRGILADAISL